MPNNIVFLNEEIINYDSYGLQHRTNIALLNDLKDNKIYINS